MGTKIWNTGRKKRKRIVFGICLAFVIVFSVIAVVAMLNGKAFKTPSSSVNSSGEVSQETSQTKPPAPDSSVESVPPVSSVPPGETDVPASEAVGTEYFHDAVFIGDSRTEGLMLYTNTGDAQFLTHKGLKVDTAFTSEVIREGDEKISVVEALKRHRYKKVYVMLGVNELGWVYESAFIQRYGELVDAIRESQPDAVVYLQSILPVSASKSASDKVYNNPRIETYNRLIRQLAEEKGVYYLQVVDAVQVDGVLPEEATTDGVHLVPAYCKKWLEYLETHTVQP